MLASLPLRLAFCVFLVPFCCVSFFAQALDCPPSPALLSSGEPAYSDAMALKQTLERHNFQIKCIFPTKLGSMFMVDEGGTLRSTIEGEACFVTNFGSVDVFFVPKPQTFADFKIAERRKARGYVYLFTGAPQVLAGNKFSFGSASREYFLQKDNQLLLVSDPKLLHRLQDALNLPPQTP